MADKKNYPLVTNEMTIREKYQKESQAYVNAIEAYTGTDPLNLWYKYICWIDDVFNQYEDDTAIMENVLQICLAKFENDKIYKNDRRLIKIFIKFMEMQDDPAQFYELLFENNTGIYVADLYVCWAYHYDKQNKFEDTERIYSMGLKVSAEPMDLLEKAQADFRFNMSRRILGTIQPDVMLCELKASHDEYASIKIKSYNLSPFDVTESLKLYQKQDDENFIGKCVSSKMIGQPKTPDMHKSLVHTIMKSAQKSRNLKPQNRPPAQKLEFNDFDGDDEKKRKLYNDSRPYPLHTDEQIGGVAGLLPGYDKIMLFPNEHICFSPEELMAYRWFKRNNIENNFTREHDPIWGSGHDVPLRWPPMFCRKSDPQEDWDLPPLNDDDLNLKPGYMFNFRWKHLYPKAGEEYSNEEIMWKKRRHHWTRKDVVRIPADTPSVFKSDADAVQAHTPIAVTRKDTPSEQLDVSPPAPTGILKKPKLSEEFKLLNDTCTTQAFNFCIKSDFVSTPKNSKVFAQPIVSEPMENVMPHSSIEFVAHNGLQDMYALQRRLDAETIDRPAASRKPLVPAGLGTFDIFVDDTECIPMTGKATPVVPATPAPPAPLIERFDIYVDKTENIPTVAQTTPKIPINPCINSKTSSTGAKEFSIYVEEKEPAIAADKIQHVSIQPQNDENAMPSTHNVYRTNVSPLKKQLAAHGASKFDHFDQFDPNLSIPISTYELNTIFKKEKSTFASKPIVAKVNVLTTNNIDNVISMDDAPETEEEYDSNDKFGRSIYVFNDECDKREVDEPEWDELTLCNDQIGSNEYKHQIVNLDETVQYIDKQLLNEKDLNPFDMKFKVALLDNIGFTEKLKNFDKNTCEMVHMLHPLKPKKTISVGMNKFNILERIGKGNFGNIFSGKYIQSGEILAFKQERPPNLWEYYICKEVQSRIGEKCMIDVYMSIDYAILGNNATIFISKFSKYGTLLNVCNKVKTTTTKNLDEYLVMILSIQMLSILKYLHAARIIHADIKPDNFLIIKQLNLQNVNGIILQLIDFGQSIDMRLFPRNQMFHNKLTTDNFICTEMLDNRPWSYQHDFFCLAGTIFTMLCGKYMTVIKRKNRPGYDTQTIPRYYNKAAWMNIFDRMINITDSMNLPKISDLQDILNEEIRTHTSSDVEKKINLFNSIIEKGT